MYFQPLNYMFRSWTQVQMDEQIVAWVNMAGACERIFKTGIPSAYTRHTSRFLMTYLTIMPLIVWDAVRWLAVPLCFVVAFLLLGTENIGAQIEEPFHVLPLEEICRSMHDNVLEMVNCHEAYAAPAAARPEAPNQAWHDCRLEVAPHRSGVK